MLFWVFAGHFLNLLTALNIFRICFTLMALHRLETVFRSNTEQPPRKPVLKWINKKPRNHLLINFTSISFSFFFFFCLALVHRVTFLLCLKFHLSLFTPAFKATAFQSQSFNFSYIISPCVKLTCHGACSPLTVTIPVSLPVLTFCLSPATLHLPTRCPQTFLPVPVT